MGTLFQQSARGWLPSVHLATQSVLRHRRRSGFAMAAIAFGVCALILAGGFIEWIFWAAREGAIQSGLGHVHVIPRADRAKGTPIAALPGSSPILAELSRAGGVKTVSPRLAFSGLASHQETTLSFLGEGLDPASERKAENVSIIVRGEDLSPEAPDGVIIGLGLGRNLGLSLGDKVVLLVNKPGGGINAVEARVRGFFATLSKAYDDSAIRVPLRMAHELLGVSGADRWVVYLQHTEETDARIAGFRKRYAGRVVDFVPWYELADFYNKTVALLSRQMTLVRFIIGLIIVLTISNSMMMAVAERTSEIGTSMALGTRKRGILLQFITEGALLGVAGGVLGVAIGVALAHLISAIGIPMPPPPGQTQGYRAGMIVTVPAAGIAFALALATALIAALYPAWRASRLQIVEALRHNR